ncbi:hypothetical protein HKX48_006183 [Thoreauomyces humboldtii]|nr:hypothetical protein HKX48_006183 [Thoreauomyces humboldtii]
MTSSLLATWLIRNLRQTAAECTDSDFREKLVETLGKAEILDKAGVDDGAGTGASLLAQWLRRNVRQLANSTADRNAALLTKILDGADKLVDAGIDSAETSSNAGAMEVLAGPLSEELKRANTKMEALMMENSFMTSHVDELVSRTLSYQRIVMSCLCAYTQQRDAEAINKALKQLVHAINRFCSYLTPQHSDPETVTGLPFMLVPVHAASGLPNTPPNGVPPLKVPEPETNRPPLSAIDKADLPTLLRELTVPQMLGVIEIIRRANPDFADLPAEALFQLDTAVDESMWPEIYAFLKTTRD